MRLLVLLISLSSICLVIGWRCYACNSDREGTKCLDESLDKNLLKKCPTKMIDGTVHQPIGCRKTEQYVGSQFTMIRECAYTGSDVRNKNNKGSTGVSRWTNQCSDEHGCNGISPISPLLTIIASFMCAILLLK
ncbi:unnamed protein product, partial [Mesorhabditis belari]|uniref:Protein sleepless n=1 Tax=Mesorhabditis belari TaxID=2138241 RepID=A0AAF3FBL4_9BILA